jgi:hypothetical protein
METDVGKERFAAEIASLRGMGTARTRLPLLLNIEIEMLSLIILSYILTFSTKRGGATFD